MFSELSSNITVYNDVDAALLGELSLHNYEENNIFCLTLGTGIGGAFYNKSMESINVHVIEQMKLVICFIVLPMTKHLNKGLQLQR